MKKQLAVLLAASMLVCLGACAGAGSKPPQESEKEQASYLSSGELRIQVPFKTGGALDVQVRTTAKYLGEELGVNVIVENTPGAGGQLGTTEYLKEEPNAPTILLTDAWLMTVTPLLTSVQYTADDFIPIIDHNTTDFCLFANPAKSGIKDFEGLKTYGQQNRVLFGSGGAGTSLYIVQKSLLDNLGIASDTITQSAATEGLANLMAGTVDVTMSAFSGAEDYVKSGEIVPILWFGEGTYSDGEAFEGVPSAQECGVGINYNGFYYYSIRSGSDQAFVDQLYDAFTAVYQNPKFIADCETQGFVPAGMKGEEISTYLDEFSEMASTTFTLE